MKKREKKQRQRVNEGREEMRGREVWMKVILWMMMK
jgi:hypothetical protein